MDATNANRSSSSHGPWNKGKLVGQKAPFKLKPRRLHGKAQDEPYPFRRFTAAGKACPR
jgi:hypothetical protein